MIRRRIGLIVGIIATVAALAIGGLALAYNFHFWPFAEQAPTEEATAPAASTTTPAEGEGEGTGDGAGQPDYNPLDVTLDENEKQEVYDALTINLDDFNDPANVREALTRIEMWFNYYSMPVKDAEVVAATKAAGYEFSDPVTMPFSSDKLDYDGVIMELDVETFQNMVFAEMQARALVNVKVGDKTIGELNPWLVEFLELCDAAHALAANIHPRGNEVWLIRDVATGKARMRNLLDTADGKGHDYKTYVMGIAMLHDSLIFKGLQTMESSVNYELNRMSKSGSDRRATPAAEQENKPAYIFQYVTKSGKVALTIGYNRYDKRIEIFETKKEVTPPASTTTNTKPNPGGGEDPSKPKPGTDGEDPNKPKPGGGGGNPGKPNPQGDGNGSKDKTTDPVENGNAPTYGGDQDNHGPGPVEGKGDTTPTDADPNKGDKTIVAPADGGTSGYNSGQGPTGTSGTSGDVDAGDDRTVQGTDNDTPGNAGPITGTGGGNTTPGSSTGNSEGQIGGSYGEGAGGVNNSNPTDAGTGTSTGGQGNETSNGTVNPFN